MAIKFKRVNYIYQGMDGTPFRALKDINLTIEEKGEFITLIGETGSGKSTLVQHMNALIKPTSGQVEIYGIKIEETKKKSSKIKLNPLRQKIGLVFQFPDYQLFEETVERDIMFGPMNFGISKEEAKKRAKEVIQLVGLETGYLERSPFNLSGGEKKRVSIAGILAMEPDILVLDEPTSGLDPKGRDELLELFLSIHNKLNNTVLIITHDMNTVYQYASRVLVMNDGNLVFDGKPIDLFASPKLSSWNLDKPDLIDLCDKLSERLNITFENYPKDLEKVVARIKAGYHE
ncbi:MAG: energy-coupling factor transporter ATPase [Candidatus Izimaplasma sp.]|nr:energy-coupling factor transporter ATPase [Candidatus Izimaplasma bacterium]